MIENERNKPPNIDCICEACEVTDLLLSNFISIRQPEPSPCDMPDAPLINLTQQDKFDIINAKHTISHKKAIKIKPLTLALIKKLIKEMNQSIQLK